MLRIGGTGPRPGQMTTSDSERISQLADRAELLDLLHAYCRAVDRRDYALLASLYHPDAQDDHGGLFRGSAADYIAWLPGMLARFSSTSHYIHNAEFRLTGDQAEGQSCVVAHHMTLPPDPVGRGHGRPIPRTASSDATGVGASPIASPCSTGPHPGRRM